MTQLQRASAARWPGLAPIAAAAAEPGSAAADARLHAIALLFGNAEMAGQRGCALDDPAAECDATRRPVPPRLERSWRGLIRAGLSAVFGSPD